jgi:hypothetical protein
LAADYAREKFTAGLFILAEGQGGLRQRLVDAYVDQVHHTRPEKQLPPAVSQRIEALRRRMTSVAQKGEEGSIAATVAAMTDDDVVGAVHEIVAIALGLQSP